MTTIKCPLCGGDVNKTAEWMNTQYAFCAYCLGIWMWPNHLPTPEEERAQYLTHNNDVLDPGYQKFVTPLVNSVKNNHLSGSHGLDYGAGTGPVIAKLLTDDGYRMQVYDPFFHNHPEALHTHYDFVVCNEVIEHFHYPANDFSRMADLLKPGGSLFCHTQIYHPSIDFNRWYYIKDPTHVFFYRKETFEYIRKQFQFSEVSITGNLIHFRK